jgi:arsenate reductase (glutaredoxin)
LPESETAKLDQRKAIALMLEHPSAIKRPVLDVDGRLLVGFKPDEYAKVFSKK